MQSAIDPTFGRANDTEQLEEAAGRIAKAAEQLRAFAL
jgi:hypothetical protein